jgi:hypothetical protein
VDIYRKHRFCAVALSGVLLIQRLWRRTSRRRLRGQRWVVVNGLEAQRAAQRAVRRSARLLATSARALQSARLAARWLAERGLATIGVQGAMDTFNRGWSACMEGRGYSVKRTCYWMPP